MYKSSWQSEGVTHRQQQAIASMWNKNMVSIYSNYGAPAPFPKLYEHFEQEFPRHKAKFPIFRWPKIEDYMLLKGVLRYPRQIY
jgi:hypothetical protein